MAIERRAVLAGVLAAAALLASGAAAAQLVRGKDYQLVEPPQPTQSGAKIELIEFFWYGCPHCNAMQPSLRGWLRSKPSDVEFRRMPAVLGDSWIPLTRAYYALEAMGLTERLHHEVFSAIHEHKVRLQDPKVLFDWVAARGVDRQRFADTYRSFGVQSRVQAAIETTRRYGIPFTPVVVVDGRYLTAPSMTVRPDNRVDYERFYQVLEQVIAMARKARGAR